MKTSEQDIDIHKMNQVAQDILAFAFLLHNIEHDPNGTLSLTANLMMGWASSIFDALESENQSESDSL